MADPVAVRKAKEAVRPATKAGFETVEFDDGKAVVEKFTNGTRSWWKPFPPLMVQSRLRLIFPNLLFGRR
jgi:hypothetical protein